MLACFEVIWSLTTRVEVRRRERRYWRSMQAAARRWTAVPMNMTFDLSVWIVWSIQIVVSEPMTYGLRTYLKCRKVGLRGSEQSVEALNDTNSSVSSAYCWLINSMADNDITNRWQVGDEEQRPDSTPDSRGLSLEAHRKCSMFSVSTIGRVSWTVSSLWCETSASSALCLWCQTHHWSAEVTLYDWRCKKRPIYPDCSWLLVSYLCKTFIRFDHIA
jgi:hypothetical protein